MKPSLFVIDKTPGPTSFDIVRETKKIFNEKVGHAGSLDPFASGVLILLVGRATKFSNALLTADKSYRALVKLGEATDTMDRTGTATKTLPVPALTTEQVERVLRGFVGTWEQVPPSYSAKKIHGVRMYALARANISVRRTPIPVQLYRMQLVRWEHPFIEFEVDCSKGTYIRSLAQEIGERLGTCGHLSELRRLSCGSFELKDSVTVAKLSENPEAWLETGYQNFVKLVNGPRVLTREHHLQIPHNSGNSLA